MRVVLSLRPRPLPGRCALLGVVEALRSAALRTPHTGLVAGLRPPPASAHSAHTAGAGGGPGRPRGLGAWAMAHAMGRHGAVGVAGVGGRVSCTDRGAVYI